MKSAAAFTCLLTIGLISSSCSSRNDLAQFGDFRMTTFENQAGVPMGTSTGSGTPAAASTPVVVSSEMPQQSISTTQQATFREQLKESIPNDFIVRTTAYTHLEEDSLPYGTKSALGNDLQFGQIRSAAADWSRYPVGTRFKIKGLPYEYVVDDYGSALVGTDTIDLYKPNHSKMNQWGARHVGIEVLEWGSFEQSRKILRTREHKAQHVREMRQEIDKKIETIPPDLRDGFGA